MTQDLQSDASTGGFFAAQSGNVPLGAAFLCAIRVMSAGPSVPPHSTPFCGSQPRHCRPFFLGPVTPGQKMAVWDTLTVIVKGPLFYYRGGRGFGMLRGASPNPSSCILARSPSACLCVCPRFCPSSLHCSQALIYLKFKRLPAFRNDGTSVSESLCFPPCVCGFLPDFCLLAT